MTNSELPADIKHLDRITYLKGCFEHRTMTLEWTGWNGQWMLYVGIATISDISHWNRNLHCNTNIGQETYEQMMCHLMNYKCGVLLST